MANNDFDPNVMQQLMQMYKEGKIPNMNPNMGMGGMNPNMGMGGMNPNMGIGGMNPNMGMGGMNPNMGMGGMNPNMGIGGMNPNMGIGGMNPNMGIGGMNPNMGMGGMNPNMGMGGMNPNMGIGGMNPMFWNNQGFMNQQNLNMVNPNQPQNESKGENWTIHFLRKYDSNKITIQINSDETVSAAYSKYRIKSLESDLPLKFTFKGKPLDGSLSLSASGLNNNDEITVEKTNASTSMHNKIEKSKPGFWTLIFERKDENKFISVQVESRKKVKDAISSFKNKLGKEEEMIFIFNSKTLMPEMDLKAAGLKDGSKILVISTSQLEGA